MFASWRAALAAGLGLSGLLAAGGLAITLSIPARSAPAPALAWLSLALLVAAAFLGWLHLRAVERSRRALAIGVTHHLRTSLSHIRTFDEMLLLEPDASEEQRRHWLEIIGREAHRLGAAVENLLFLVQGSRRREFPVRRPVDLGGLLEDVACDHAPAAGRGVRIDVAPPTGIIVEADADALRHALGNLLDGAARTAREGSTIHATADAAGRLARVCVSFAPDREGEAPGGTPWGELDADRLEGCTGEGFGLELAVVRHVARQHGGRASRTQDPGVTCFRVELPLARG